MAKTLYSQGKLAFSRFYVLSYLVVDKDYIYSQIFNSTPLPSKFSLEPNCTPVRNQGKLGSCVGFGTACSVKGWQEAINYPGNNYVFSPLFVWKLCKQEDGIPNDEGTYIRVAYKILQQTGVVFEQTMPYTDEVKLPVVFKPTEQMLKEAEKFKIKSYARVQTLQEIKQAIYYDGVVGAGVFVATNFLYPEQNKFIAMPSGFILGSHMIAIVGWDDNLEYTYRDSYLGKRTFKGFFRIRNSWSSQWGDNGYAFIPFDFLTQATDLGIPYLLEAWTSIDLLIDPPKNDNVEKLEMWVGSNIVKYNGISEIIDQSIIVDPKTNRSLAPLRYVFEKAGWKVDYIATEKKIIATRFK